jgi:hypothetical protein
VRVQAAAAARRRSYSGRWRAGGAARSPPRAQEFRTIPDTQSSLSTWPCKGPLTRVLAWPPGVVHRTPEPLPWHAREQKEIPGKARISNEHNPSKETNPEWCRQPSPSHNY